MAQSRPLERFPASLFTLAHEAAFAEGASLPPLPFASPREARTFRNTFYAFRKQLRQDAHHSGGPFSSHAHGAERVVLRLSENIIEIALLGFPLSKEL